MSLRNPRTWIGALVAAYLVLLFPACWSGAQIRAQQQGVAGPNSSNNNEEREEHEQHETIVQDAQGQRPPLDPPAIEIAVPRIRVAVSHQLRASVASSPNPAVLSVRRLL
jgi:hypothetical protein